MQVEIKSEFRTFQAEMLGDAPVVRDGDVNELVKSGYHVEDTINGRLDVLLITAPCQDFSPIGSRAGIAGEKGSVLQATLAPLFPLKEKNMLPKLILLENVKACTYKSNIAKTPPPILTAIDTLHELGYQSVAYRCCNAAEHSGLPMDRERIFLVASLSDNLAVEVLFAPEVIQECSGCSIGVDSCYWCSQIQQESRKSDSGCVFTVHMHSANAPARKDVLSTITTTATKCLLITPTAVGTLSENQRLRMFSLPPYFLSSLDKQADRNMALGNCVHLDSALWLLSRVLECWDLDVDRQTSAQQLVDEPCRSTSLDATISSFKYISWKDDSRPHHSTASTHATLPLHAVFMRGVGAFALLNIHPCPSPFPFKRLTEVLDMNELNPVTVEDLHTLLFRMGLYGIACEPEMLSRLITFAKSKRKPHLLMPPTCQMVLKDIDLLPARTGYVFIQPLDQFWPVELYKDDALRKLGRPALPLEPLLDGEMHALIAPLNKNLSSRTGHLILPIAWRGYFKVKVNDVCNFGSPEAVQAFAATRAACCAATDPQAALRLSLLDDAQLWIQSIEDARSGKKGCSLSFVVRFLRATAAKFVVTGGWDAALDIALGSKSAGDVSKRKQLGAAFLGGTAAFVSVAGHAAKGYKVELWVGEDHYKGTVLNYDKDTLQHELLLDGSNEVVRHQLFKHNCVLKILNQGAKRARDAVVPDDIYKKKRSRGAAEIPLESIKLGSIRMKALIENVCMQSLMDHGRTFELEGMPGTFLQWKECKDSPTVLYSIFGLFGSLVNKGIGRAPFIYYKSLYKCIRAVWKYLAINNKGVALRLSLCFALPAGAPERLRKVMPVLCGTAGNVFPQWVDLTEFAKLNDSMKRELRHQFFTYVSLNNGNLPPAAQAGAETRVVRFIAGEKVSLPMEIPNWG